jgi:phage baseplate assembly protein W
LANRNHWRLMMVGNDDILGVGWGFPPRFDPHTRTVVMVSDAEDIRQSLFILFGTTPGERVMHPSYGCDLRHLVFEMLNQSVVTDIRDTIQRAVRLFEPRIILEDVSVESEDWFEGVLRIALSYTVISTNTRHNLVYPLYLLQGSSAGYEA